MAQRFLLVFLVLSVLGSIHSMAQDSTYVREEAKDPIKDFKSSRDQKEIIPWEDKLFVGFYPGFQFGSAGTVLEFSPLVGYKVLPRLFMGVGGIYKYFAYTNYFGSRVKSNNYGARAFAFVDIYKGFMAYSEYEGLSLEYLDQNAVSQREWQTAIKAGAGFKSMIGARSFINILFLYNLSYDRLTAASNSPFEYRAGIVFFPFKSKIH